MGAPATATIRSSSFSFGDPWAIPPTAAGVTLRDATDGAPPRLATQCSLFRDEGHLYVVFSADDDGIVATHLEHDAPLYEEDAFEIFLAPDTLTEYYEIEVNPLGTTLDAKIVSPDGHRGTMRFELQWECIGMWTAVHRVDSRTEAVVAIPFAAFDRQAPQAGEQWRANLYRIDRSAKGDQYSAWSPTLRTPADFHVPAAFGILRFA